MAEEHPAALADRLFSTFLAPLVLGGRMPLERPIGFRRAFVMNADLRPVDSAAWTNVGLARVRVARKFAPVDSLTEIGAIEWAMAAALHDFVQSTHPNLSARFGGKRAHALLELCGKTLEHVPDCHNSGEALARHTLFARTLEVARTVTKVSWWTGSATFVGVDPPARLLAWPGARRVQVYTDPVRLERLVNETHLGLPAETAMRSFLMRTPLTDWCTVLRSWPEFSFTQQNLGLVATNAGRKLVLRALRSLPQAELDVTIGRALSPLVKAKSMQGLRAALDVFGEHVLEESLHAIHDPDERKQVLTVSSDAHAALAQAAGALAAREYLGMHGDAFSEIERRAILRRLLPHTQGAAAEHLQSLWPALAA